MEVDNNNLKSYTPITELLYTLLVSDVMEKNVITVNICSTMREVKDVMKHYHITGMPVVDDDGFLKGVISMSDLLDALTENCIEDEVSKWMTKKVLTIHENTNLIKAFNLLDKYKIGRVPVLNDEKHIIGIITNGTIIKKMLYRIDKQSVQTEKEIADLVNQLNLKSNIDKPIKFEWPLQHHDFENAGKLSSEIKKYLKKMQINRSIIRKVSIASYEAEMNTIIHSIGGCAKICINNNRLRAEFIDKGPGIEDVDKALEIGFSTAPPIARELGFGAGLGLPNIQSSVDKFELSSTKNGPTTLIFEVNFINDASVKNN